jgi:hypothetical protein
MCAWWCRSWILSSEGGQKVKSRRCGQNAAATISAGEWITASGWVNDRHGQQFKARFLRTSPPTSADGIEKYLSSGMIRGVGPVYAKKLVRAFGEKVFEVIETTGCARLTASGQFARPAFSSPGPNKPRTRSP